MGRTVKNIAKPLAGAALGYFGGPLLGTTAAKGALAGGLLGGALKGKDPNYSSASSDLLGQISADFYNQTSPVRNQLIDRSNQFLSGNMDVTQSPMYGSLKNAIESQYGLAKQNLLASSQAGGALTGAMANLEGQKAGSLASGIGNLAEQEMNRAMNIGMGGQQIASTGLSGAGAIQGNLAMARAQQQAGAKQGLGSGVGYMLGRK